MSATFSWSVATPEGTVASGECDFLVVPTSGGELGVLADHAALVASVVPGDLRVTTGGEVRTVSVGRGVVDVRDNRVRLLVTRAAEGGFIGAAEGGFIGAAEGGFIGAAEGGFGAGRLSG